MVIDFTSTSEQHGVVEYYNVRGNSVRTYELSRLEEWVKKNNLNLSYDHDSDGGTGVVSDPDTNFTEKEVYQDMTDYLDNNWAKVTEDFYNAMNPNDYKSQNKPQQTKETV